jgi:hypothetical protein
VRRSLAAGIWLALTITATLIVWAAVSVVAADVTDRPAPVVAHRDVVVALQAGAEHPPTTTTTTTVPRLVPPTAAPPVTSRPATTVVGNRGAPTTITILPPPPTTPRAPTTTKAPARPTTTTTLIPPGTATYSTAGGSVAVACIGYNSIRLVAALPNDGFQAVVVSGGPFGVQVNFLAPGRNISVSAACFFSQPFEYTQGQAPAIGPPTT